MERRRKVFGWGSIGDGLTGEEESAALERFSRLFGTSEFERRPVPDVAALELPPPRLAPPASLQAICSDARYERALHCFGKSYSDAVQGLLGEYDGAPDIVIFPHNESEIAAALDWAASQGATVTPFGGGSSVVGGVGSGRRTAAPVVTLDLRRFDRVLEVDRVSRSARIAAGVFGPALESQLKPHGLTLRHFPQSFEHSTLGGWIATRSAGHYASLRTHIDDFVEGVRVVSPRGAIAMRRFPASGAGPSPERLFIGSEGILGVITEAWVRLSVRPTFRAGRAAWFPDFYTAAQALKAIIQADLHPANCRIIDPQEAANAGAGDGSRALMVLGFEGWDRPLDDLLERALLCVADHGGCAEPEGSSPGAARIWRNAFIRMPYLRERIVPRAIISDTFETAVTWDKFERLHTNVVDATSAAINATTGRAGQVTCRITHVYADGPAPYFSFHALGGHGALMEQWRAIKAAASEAVLAAGGTITHHHAVGRTHRQWYDRERPELFALALRAAKAAVDPTGLLNPGVLIDA